MESLRLNCGFESPWHTDFWHPQQQEFLMHLFRSPAPNGTLTVGHFVGGRGAGKTATLIMALLESAINQNPGIAHLWTSVTYSEVGKALITQFEQHVDSSAWKLNKSDHVLRIRNRLGGWTPVFYSGRDSNNSNKDSVGRGPNYAAAFFDEIALDRSDKAWATIFPAVRARGAGRLFIGTATTPRMGWYHTKVMKSVHNGLARAFYASSYDNPHQSKERLDQFLAELTPKMARQEIYAEWISQSDLIWDVVDLQNDWPAGNRWPEGYDPTLPYVLACDLGRRSGWMVIQTLEDYRTGEEVDVVVAEYTPNKGDTDSVVAHINGEYGEPERVIVGSDVDTANIVDSKTSMMIFRSAGWTCPIVPVRGLYARKELQYLSAKRLLLNAKNQRRFCVSHKLRTFEPNDRGIIEVLSQDTWDSGTPRRGEYLPKDKAGGGVGLEDIRDAFLYWAVTEHPIRATKQILSNPDEIAEFESGSREDIEFGDYRL